MKLSKISFAAALACAALSSQAAMTGAAATALDDANTNHRVIYISGASAIQKGFDQIVSGLFTAGSTTYYSAGSNAGNGTKADYVAVVGQLASTIGSWSAGTNVIVQYRTLGGSGFGVFPVARNQAISFSTVTSAACTPGASNSLAVTATCTGTVNVVPDAGVSDVDPSFGAFDNQFNTPFEVAANNLTTSEISALGTKTHIYGLAFGIPVTNNVPTSVNFNKTLLSAILSGNVGTWDQVDKTLAADDIVICRRTPGSGTQVIANAAFGNYPCSTAHSVAAPIDRTTNPYWVVNGDGTQTINVGANQGAAIVIENDTSGDLKNCLTAAATGGSFSTHDRDGIKSVAVSFGGTVRKAIGLLSLDSLNAGSAAANSWSFRALGGAGQITQTGAAAPVVTAGSTGVLPTFADVISGNYDLVSQETFMIPVRTLGEKAVVLNQIAANAANPAILANTAALQYVAGVFPASTLVGAAPAGNTLRTTFVGGDFCAPLQRNN